MTIQHSENENTEVIDDNKEMGFLDHLEDLRWTLMKSVVALFVAFIIVGVFIFNLADVLKWPLKKSYEMLGVDSGSGREDGGEINKASSFKVFIYADSHDSSLPINAGDGSFLKNGKPGVYIEYDGTDEAVLKEILASKGKKIIISGNDVDTGGLTQSFNNPDGGLRTNAPMEIITVILQCVVFGGFAVAAPFICFFVAQFILPALTLREKKLLMPGVIAAVILFLLGAAFTFFVLMPFSLYVMIQLNQQFHFEVLWNADSYYSMLVWFTIGVGLTCEFPLVLLLLIYLGILQVSTLTKSRRVVFTIILVAAAILTPTGDPFTLFLVAIPLYLLYEGAIFVGKRMEAKAKAKEEAANSIYYEEHD